MPSTPDPSSPELPADLMARPPVFEVRRKGPETTDAALAGLIERRPFHTLELDGCAVTGGGFHLLRDQPLSGLRLRRCPLTPGGFRRVTEFWKLRTLHLVECPLPQDWTAVLARLPELESLVLTGARVPERSFRGIHKLERLRRFTAHGPSEYLEHPDPVDDDALRALGRSTTLASLDLWRGKSARDAGLRGLAGMPALRRLAIGDPDHTFDPSDAGLASLGALPALEILELHTCGRVFTASGGAALSAFPKLAWLYLEACHPTAALEAALGAGWVPLPRQRPGGIQRWWRRREADEPS